MVNPTEEKLATLKQRFTQIHALISYPAANLNRDDSGRPKTVVYGGDQRLRISSQCSKRNWRTSAEFEQHLAGNIGVRTKLIGIKVYDKLISAGVKEDTAKKFAKEIAEQFGKLKKPDSKKKTEENSPENDNKQSLKELEIEQLVHLSQAELAAIEALVNKKIQNHELKPDKKDLELLRKENTDVDIALWGRMLASSAKMNVEAACQVAHAFSVNAATIEDDFFTALDDLNDGTEDSGAGHVDDAGFSSGLFYSYICINNQLLLDNLGGNKALAEKTIRALIHAITTVTPSGKQNSFATRAYACYGLVELGNQQPRSLAMSYLKSLSGKNGNLAELAITALEDQRAKFDSVYGKCATDSASFNAVAGVGKVADVINKAAGVFA